MIYPRHLTKELLKQITTPQIIVVTGMRQVGKTSLMRQIFDSIQDANKLFLDLENPLNQKIFEEENFDNILFNLDKFGVNTKKKLYLFLDEIQLIPRVSQTIKYLYDHYEIKFFLTGSSSFYLKNLFPESLAGRKIIYELFPLNFEEFLIFKQQKKPATDDFSKKAEGKSIIDFEMYKKLYEEYLQFGGFPRVVLESENKTRILEDIFTSYFEKDVRTLADFKEISKLRDLILLLAKRAGSKIEITKLSRELGTSRETIYSYLNFLEQTYFIFILSPFSTKIDNEVRGAKKVYFCDTGILNYMDTTDEGSIFENAVFQNLKKYGTLHYYEKYKGPEIDFILNKKIAFEVKTFGDISDLKKLHKISSAIKLKNYYLINKNYLNHPKSILALDL